MLLKMSMNHVNLTVIRLSSMLYWATSCFLPFHSSLLPHCVRVWKYLPPLLSRYPLILQVQHWFRTFKHSLNWNELCAFSWRRQNLFVVIQPGNGSWWLCLEGWTCAVLSIRFKFCFGIKRDICDDILNEENKWTACSHSQLGNLARFPMLGNDCR